MMVVVLLVNLVVPNLALALNDEEEQALTEEIDAKREAIEKLDKEIAEHRNAVNSASGRASNLQGTIKILEATKLKLQTDIKKTQTEMEKTDLTIKKLNLDIVEKEYLLQKNLSGLAESVRRSNAIETTSTIDRFLGFESLSEFWSDFELTEKLQKQLTTEVENLDRLSRELKSAELSQRNERENLTEQQKQLSGQTVAVQHTQAEKATLLAATKNEEAGYKALLAKKLEEKKIAEAEIYEIESKLHYTIDPNGYLSPRHGILDWPVSGFRLTQNFGNTGFARSNPQFYSTGFHNGVDLAVPMGTEIKAPADGYVKGFGNTDLFPGCRSWGGWLMIQHPNGLSTLYGHLSSSIVSVGQEVKKGQIVAYSGSTGISTGPHLHFGTYISQAVQIKNYRDVAPSTRGCGAYNVNIPMASHEAYLDPLQYLPAL